MASDAGLITCKVLLIILDSLYLATSLVLLACGIVVVVDVGNLHGYFSNTVYEQVFNDDTIKVCGIYMIVLGGAGAIVSIYGLFAAAWTSKRMLTAYALAMTFQSLACIVLVAYAGTYFWSESNYEDSNLLTTMLLQFGYDVNITNGVIAAPNIAPSAAVDAAWMRLQYSYQCCGVHGYLDYQFGRLSPTWTWTPMNYNGLVLARNKVPVSCCTTNTSGSGSLTRESQFISWTQCVSGNMAFINTQGCLNTLVSGTLAQFSALAVGLTSGLLGLALLLIGLSCVTCLVKSRRQRRLAAQKQAPANGNGGGGVEEQAM